MFNTCGNTVQSVWVSTLVTCWYSSTDPFIVAAQTHSTYGNLLLSRILIQNNPLSFAQVNWCIFTLLGIGFSTQSTPPIITYEKRT